jgi:hypothetical protein
MPLQLKNKLTRGEYDDEKYFRQTIYPPIFLEGSFYGSNPNEDSERGETDDCGRDVGVREYVLQQEDNLVEGGFRMDLVHERYQTKHWNKLLGQNNDCNGGDKAAE